MVVIMYMLSFISEAAHGQYVQLEKKHLGLVVASKIPGKWREFGRFAGFDEDTLDAIKIQYKDHPSPDQGCFTHVIFHAPDSLTWSGVIEWLKNMNELKLATELEEKFTHANASQKEYFPTEGT